jgi:1-acyl-sn-glycerol-3-phosphate acyltransferase
MPDWGDRLKDAFRDWTYELGGPGFRERLEKLTPPANEYGVDPYGFDAQFTVSAIAPFLWLYRKYFRVATYGLDKVPADGRVLIVANHSGQLPFDAAMLVDALLVD